MRKIGALLAALLSIAIILGLRVDANGAPMFPAMLQSVSEVNEPVTRESAITRIEINRVESPTFDGRRFGDVGQYEKIYATAYGEVDPTAPRNQVIADVELAPVNARGMVEYSVDLHLIKPVNLDQGNRRIFYTVNNRGNKGLGAFLGSSTGGNDPTTAADAGTGLLMRKGYTLVWSGWEDERLRPPGDNRVLAQLPVAVNPDGSPIVEDIVYEHIFDTSWETEISMVRPGVRDGLKYTPATLDQSRSRLRVRNNSQFVGGPLVDRVEVPDDAWEWTEDGALRIDRTHPFLAPYDAGAAFELTYPAINPIVQGLGFASVRDVVAFLRHSSSEENPLRGGIDYALGTGSSQTGRYLRDFLYYGFNEDLSGEKVFEGVMPRVAGAHRIALNERFGDPDNTGRSYERELTSKMVFPFTYEVREDPITGEKDGIFARCEDSATCPKVMQFDHGNEAWLKAMNLLTQDGAGNDIELPDEVRVYYAASTPHGTGGSGPSGSAVCQYLSNPAYSAPYLRALFMALDEWATDGVEPPESRYPRSDDGTLAPALPQEELGFPDIPGVTYTGWHIPLAVKDMSSLPPTWIEGRDYEVLLPTTDEDGNDVAGIRPIEVEVPLGTYMGWNLRRAPFAENEDCGNAGSYIPFVSTREERLEKGDPRLSIEERYDSYDDYIQRVHQAVQDRLDSGLILEEDAEPLRARLASMWARFPSP